MWSSLTRHRWPMHPRLWATRKGNPAGGFQYRNYRLCEDQRKTSPGWKDNHRVDFDRSTIYRVQSLFVASASWNIDRRRKVPSPLPCSVYHGLRKVMDALMKIALSLRMKIFSSFLQCRVLLTFFAQDEGHLQGRGIRNPRRCVGDYQVTTCDR